MTKFEFLDELKSRLELASVPAVQEVVSFYDEAIADRMDAGISEEEAVAQVGSIDDIVREVKMNLPMATVVSSRIKESHETAKKSGMGWLWIAIAIVGSPVWIPLVIASVAVVFSLYITLWVLIFALVITLFALGFSGVICMLSPFSIISGTMTIPSALGSFGAGCILVALAILLWQPALLASRGLVNIIRGFFRGLKKLFV